MSAFGQKRTYNQSMITVYLDISAADLWLLGKRFPKFFHPAFAVLSHDLMEPRPKQSF